MVLASLWLMESMESVWRSPATVCLNDYLKHLAVFSPEVRSYSPGAPSLPLCRCSAAVACVLHGAACTSSASPQATPSLLCLARGGTGGGSDHGRLEALLS